ncbi:transmembrane protein 44 isoform X2 [Microcaecilia unicolor]|uniref:Transmembrane protein 44 isoform X2 n=1 Tax=Microcaecilia unicolor TaxID=1415580 RepID=A0A6P7Z5T9_9AMPH|nr:transmembrane protein 44 isoform X2 [Microcaecilia unicolor]
MLRAALQSLDRLCVDPNPPPPPPGTLRDLTGAMRDPGNGTSPGDSLWNWDYLINCFADEKVCISFGLWIIASLFWITSHALLFYIQLRRKWRQKESVAWIIYCFVGSMCNTIGAVLSKQLTIQVFTGGYMALIDVINFILTLFPVCGFRLRSKSGRAHARKRRMYRTSLFALSIPLSVGAAYFMTAGVLPLRVSEGRRGPQRRLLGTVLQESTEIMGFSLGMAAVVISWTARYPLIKKVWRGKVFPVMQLLAYFFSVLASVLYAVAVMAHDHQTEYFVRAIPWFLFALGSAALDVAIIVLSCMMKNMLMQQLGLVVNTPDISDAQILLAQEEEEEDDGDKGKDTGQEKSWMPLNVVSHPRSLHKAAEIGHYMELSIEQVQKAELSKVRLPGDGQIEDGGMLHREPPTLTDSRVQLIDTSFSSASSSEISSVDSELEWDFEDLDHPLMEGRAEMPSIQPNDSSVFSETSMSNANAAELPADFWMHEENTSLAGQISTEGGPTSTVIL